MDIRTMLEQVRDGNLTVEEAQKQLKDLPYEDLGFAKLDHHRSLRRGFGEVVYCEGKATEHLVGIFLNFAEREGNVLGTRAGEHQYEAVKEKLPDVEYDPLSRVLVYQTKKPELIGNIVVCTGGTSDIYAAEEAARTAEFFGSKVTRLYDVGVAGIHRLLHVVPQLREASCIIAVAGMEGALPGVTVFTPGDPTEVEAWSTSRCWLFRLPSATERTSTDYHRCSPCSTPARRGSRW